MLPVHFLFLYLFLYRKLLVSYKAKNAPRGCASRGEEVSCKQHRSSAKESQVTLCSKKMVAKMWRHIAKNGFSDSCPFEMLPP